MFEQRLEQWLLLYILVNNVDNNQYIETTLSPYSIKVKFCFWEFIFNRSPMQQLGQNGGKKVLNLDLIKFYVMYLEKVNLYMP